MIHRYKLLTVIILILHAGVGFSQLAPPANYKLYNDIKYKQSGEWTGLMDIYRPASPGKKALLINIHGGGWVHGSKDDQTRFSPMFAKDMVIANINYRLAKHSPAPAAIEDVRNALFYLIRHADLYDINTEKVIIMGASAGAHLALMAGMLNNEELFNGGVTIKDRFRIRGIISLYAPTDLNRWDTMHKPGKASAAWLGGRANDTSFVRSISPVGHVKNGIPPILLIHGDADRTVPYQQVLLLLNELNRYGCKYTVYTVPGGGHGNFRESEALHVENDVLRFIDSVL